MTRLGLEVVLARVTSEVHHGRTKHGPLLSPHDGFSRLRGEVMELETEVHAEDRRKRRDEALQVAAMAVRMAIEEWTYTSEFDGTSKASDPTPGTSTKSGQPS